MSSIEVTTNFRDSDGVDLGKKLITKDYLISVYPGIAQQLGITPELWTWGFGLTGQLGNNSITARSTPITTFAGGTNWIQISGGANYSAAIRSDTTLWIWGLGSYGKLGNNDGTNRSTPITTFAGGTGWKQVSCGGNHTAAVKTDGTLWVWGQGSYGRLGNNSTTNRSTPVTTFAGGNDWKQVSCKGFNTAAIKTDGTLWLWGQGSNGQLGNNAATDRSTPITTFAGGNDWKQVSYGLRFISAVKTDGTLWVWGLGSNGQLGTNNSILRSTPVTTFSGGTDWKKVSCGANYTTAIKTDGTLWLWGLGTNGQLGNNSITDRSTPVTTFAGGTNWKQVSCGNFTTAAIKTDGTLWVWGQGTNTELGTGDTVNRSTPVTTFAGGNNWKQVDSGYAHTITIKSADFI
jgi:alpha-tubulin suppressor-like RCC1 family protein